MYNINYNPSYIVSRVPERYGGKQGDYVNQARKIILDTTARIIWAREGDEDLKKLYFEIIADLSAQRALMDKSGENFGVRRETLDPRNVAFLSLTGVYQECGDRIIASFAPILAEMKSKNLEKHTITDKCDGFKSTLEIEILDSRNLRQQLCEDDPFEAGVSLTEEEFKKYKEWKQEKPDLYRKRRMGCCITHLAKEFPESVFSLQRGIIPLYVHALLRTEIDGKLYAMTDYYTWMCVGPNPIEDMKKNSRVLLAHQDVFLIEKTLEEISKIFENIVKSPQELKKSMARFCYLSSHSMRDARGTAAENEWLEEAIYASHGKPLTRDQGKMVDLEAFENPLLSRFKKSYDEMSNAPW